MDEGNKPSKMAENMHDFHHMHKHSMFKALFAVIILMVVFCAGAAFGSHFGRWHEFGRDRDGNYFYQQRGLAP